MSAFVEDDSMEETPIEEVVFVGTGRTPNVTKRIKWINMNVPQLNTRSITLHQQVKPVRIEGLRWDFTVFALTPDVHATCAWVIIVGAKPDGVVGEPTLNTANAVEFFEPTQWVLTWGQCKINTVIDVTAVHSIAGPSSKRFHGVLKTTRKIRRGETMRFRILNSDATTPQSFAVFGGIQWFER